MKAMGEPLQRKLAATRRWWRTTRLLSGLAWTVCIVVALALICYHCDRALVLTAPAREQWRVAFGIAALGTLLATLLRPLLRKLPDTALAAAVERRYPLLRERLLTTIELAPALATAGSHGSDVPGSGVPGSDVPGSGVPGSGASKSGVHAGSAASAFSEAMTASLAEETVRVTTDLNFRRAVDTRPLRVASLAALFLLLLMSAEAFFAPKAFANWLLRMRDPRADIAPFAATRVWITPDAELLPRGEGVRVTITTLGVAANQCTLRYRAAGDSSPNAWKSVDLTAPTVPTAAAIRALPGRADREEEGTPRQFRYHFSSLPQSLALVAHANDGRSNERAVLVEDRPTLINFRLTLNYPAYTHKGTQSIEANGTVVAPMGTQVSVDATANKPLKTAFFAGNGAPAGPWSVDGNRTYGKLAVWKKGSYRLKLSDLHGFTNKPVSTYEITPIEDQPPTVQIQRPATDIELVPNGTVPLVAHASDDYGITAMKLVCDKISGDNRQGAPAKARSVLTIPDVKESPNVTIAQAWKISSVQPKPGDTLRYEVDAIDNCAVGSGPHIGRSIAYNVHVFSVAEMQQKLAEKLNAEAHALALLRQHQIEAQRRLQQARQKNDNAALARAQEVQRSVAQEAKSIAQQVSDLTAQLQNNQFATPSETERRNSAQKTLDTVGQKKAPDAADTVQKAQMPKPGDPPKNRTLDQADRQQTDIKHDIEKAQNLLARTPPADQLAQELARVAQEQQRLADSSRSLQEDIKAQQKQSGDRSLTPEQKTGLEMERRQQSEANADTARLQEQIQQAAKAAGERGEKKEADALNKAASALKQGHVGDNQQQAQQSLNKNNPQAAAQPQDNAASALQKAADAAKEATGDPTETPQALADRLEKAAEKLHDLAKQQQKVANQTRQNPNAQQNKQLSGKEQSIQSQAEQTKQDLNGAPQAQQSVQNAQKNVRQAGQQLSKNQPQSAQSPASQAAQQLENAANQAQQAANQIRQQQAAQAAAEQVERLAQVQRGLENATRRLNATKDRGAQQGKPLDENTQSELQQVGAQQAQLERQTSELAQKLPSPAFQGALKMAGRQMHPATQNLADRTTREQPNAPTDNETVTAQDHAAQTLETIARALQQQAQNGPKPQQPGEQGQMSPMDAQAAQQAAALGDLLLAQGLQRQLREDTGALDQARAHNQNQALTPSQQRDAAQLSQGQRDTQQITQQAGEQLSTLPGVGQAIQQATQHQAQAGNRLQQQQTGQPTQGHQDEALRSLDQASQAAQQAMREQQMAQGNQPGMPKPVPGQQQQPGKNKGNTPDQGAFVRLEGAERGAMSSPDQRNGKGFAGLNPRSQRTLREGQQEKVPAEYQELVSRYYKSLAEKKR